MAVEHIQAKTFGAAQMTSQMTVSMNKLKTLTL